ncbi:hypothetical protein [uncultured Methanobrevibacter sp.]|uniref:hypothetical protein n=1 Tax=uncultured Methanobrevibacter sp. TaxID=253161 RepID=UPI0025F4E6A1|nr:hypothetical protein [uncultured Methanobrevibacter sp.]
MKLKNSYILIGIAIFLLISIGSVCASENVTDNVDVQTADDGKDVVLSDTDENVPDETAQEKINTTVETNDEYKFKQDSNKTLEVKVKDNSSNPISVNKDNLSVMNGNKSIAFDYTGTIMKITEALPYGIYNLTINYLGSENYINSSKVIAVKIYGNNTIETETSVVCDGKNIEIPVKVFDQAEYIDLVKDNFNLTLVYTDENGNVTNQTIGRDQFDIINNKTIKFTAPVTLRDARLIINYTNATEPKTVDIKVSTEVKYKQTKEKYTSEEIKSISITILYGQNNNLTITKNDLKVFDNGKETTSFTYNSANKNLTLNLAVGVHNIVILYKGNSTYAASNATLTMKVSGNKTMKPQETASVGSDNYTEITINLSDGADPVNVNLTNLTVTLFYKFENKTSNITVPVSNIILESDKQTIKFKVDKKFDTAYVDIKYSAENNLTGKTILKVGSETIVIPDTINVGTGEVINFTVNVTAANGTEITVSDKNIKILNNGKEVKFTCNGSVVTLTDKYNFGVYNLTVQYIGTESIATSEKIIALTVYGINATKTTTINSTKKGEIKINIINGTVPIDITKNDLNLTVTYKDGNVTKNITITKFEYTNGTLTFTLENGNFTTATLTIRYNQTEVNVTLNRIYNIEIVPVTVTNDYQDGNFTFKLVDIDDEALVLSKKTVSISMTKNGTQIYFITRTSSGGYNIGTTTSLTSDENGIVTLANQNFYPGLVISSSIFPPVGTYVATVTGSGALNGSNKTTLTINMVDVKLELEAFNEYYGTDKKVTIKVTNAKTGKALAGVTIFLNITGATLSNPNQMTNENGTIQLGVSGLPTGTYQMNFKTNDTNLKKASGSGKFTLKKIPVVINAKNVSVYFNTGTTSTITVKDKNGKAVNGMYLLVRLYTTSTKYNDYLFQTNKKGQVSFSASLAVGKHKIVINSADTRYQASQVTKTITVKKASAKITAKKVTAYYKDDKYLTVKLTNTKNNKAIYDAKLNIKIFVSKNRYYNYKGNTGMNGQIKLLLDTLKPGSYKVVVSGADSKNFNAKQVTSKIVIKKAPAKLVPKKLTAKKGAKKYFQVTVKNKKTKKVITGVKIKVKVYTGKKAKTYTLKTNTKGIAKLNVNKLKVGTHKVVVTSANKYVTAKQAKSTIKIKR